jgi:GAF domain-containing protein
MDPSLEAANGAGTERREARRVADLGGFGALDTPPGEQFDRVLGLAGVLFDMKFSGLLIVDGKGKWYKVSTDKDKAQREREIRVCARAMEHAHDVIVLDAQVDPRFEDMKFVVSEARVRFCAGAPVQDARGEIIGAMCIVSPQPREEFSDADKKKLKSLTEIVCLGIELNRHVRQARNAAAEQIRALREANARIKSSLGYADLIAEVQSPETPTDKLAIIGMTAWRQYTESGGVLTNSMKSLRERMSKDEYRDMVAMMPGFAM